jgi:hypothetical protein
MRIRTACKSSALLAFMTCVSGEALATDIAGVPVREDSRAILSAVRLVSDRELAGMRGGFFTASGAQFDFGASIRTMVNGKLALQTDLKWTAAGPVTQQLSGLGAQIQSQVNDTVAKNLALAGIASPLPNSAAGATQTAGAATLPTAAPAPAPAAATPPPAPSPATPSPSDPVAAAAAAPAPAPNTAPVDSSTLVGVQVPGQGGSTQVFANVGGGQIQNIIMNSANGQTITQNTNIMLTIYNYQQWQSQLGDRMVALRLASDMLAASGLSAGH